MEKCIKSDIMSNITVKKLSEVHVETLHVDAGVRYWKDATVNGKEDTEGDLIPCREGDRWKPIIDLATGKITNWNIGTEADIHYKVCGDGKYSLLDKSGSVIVFRDGYVPSVLYPNQDGYGDYIILNVDKDGMIEGWEHNLSDFNETIDE